MDSVYSFCAIDKRQSITPTPNNGVGAITYGIIHSFPHFWHS